jgi:hypothetical protein
MSRILVFIVFSAIASAPIPLQQLSPQQKEVWKGEENHFRYLQEKDLQNYMSLWDYHFVGWPDYEPRPVGKSAIESSVRDQFHSQTSGQSLPVPSPEAVTLFGDVAITHYFWPEAD